MRRVRIAAGGSYQAEQVTRTQQVDHDFPAFLAGQDDFYLAPDDHIDGVVRISPVMKDVTARVVVASGHPTQGIQSFLIRVLEGLERLDLRSHLHAL